MRNYLYFIIGAVGMFVLLTSEIEYSTGSPGGKSGSPGDGGATCTDCHGGTATFQEGWITANIPAEGYIPGETYTITATGTHEGVGKFGFEVTSENDGAQKAGSMIVTNSVENQLANGNQSITHKSTGTTPTGNTKTWMFDWTAPAEGTGNITFYGAFNAANGNGNNSGDVIYTSSLLVPEATATLTGLNVHFTGMTPHIGQLLEARLIDKSTQKEVERLAIDEITGAEFDIVFSNIEEGKSYWVDFYADLNDNGYYDGIPTDHAWRLTFNDITDGVVQNFTHNTNFSEIYWKHMYELEFNNMSPHIGQKLEVRLIEQSTLKEAGRATIDAISTDEFSVFLPYLESGVNYDVDFYADLNGNGVYDAPPADHAWRIELTDVEGDEDDDFIHNTNFTDIGWNYRFTLQAMGMSPHMNQLFELRVVQQATLQEVGRVSLDSIVMIDYAAMTTGLAIGEDYFIDFYADHNGNGSYDPPPTDHAWRMELNDVQGDSELNFTHNINFTDIQWPLTSINEISYSDMIKIFPNPANDQVNVKMLVDNQNMTGLQLFDMRGNRVQTFLKVGNPDQLRVEISDLPSGMYYLLIQLESGIAITKRIVKL
jgi:hypothetical protein